MKRIQIITTAFLTVYLLTIVFTDVSLTGYWTDVVFALCLAVFALIMVSKGKPDRQWSSRLLRLTTFFLSALIFTFMLLSLVNPFGWDKFQMRHFGNEVVNGRHFNAYFSPVGAWGSGYGSFWITESSKYFPVIEWTVYYERATDINFGEEKFEDTPIENVVRSIIEDDIVNDNGSVESNSQ